ncbi:MAG: putative toxin-antitoxin system toxin component, PIN family [Syntrophorhabdus sp.]|nr:putative toxin-antitoxin system toxin component, PIN family [Syntrophorhabdus sp.]
MPVRVVIDTNVWISSLIAPGGSPSILIDAWRNDRFITILSEEQSNELFKVLTRPVFSSRYNIQPKEVFELTHLMSVRSEHVTLKNNMRLCRDPDDDRLIEAAVRGKARYLITGDRDLLDDGAVRSFLLRKRVDVVTVSQFLRKTGIINE